MYQTEIKNIRIAILGEEPLGWGSGKHYFPIILNSYSWKTEEIKYKFTSKYVYDRDIIQGKLNRENFDVFLIPGGGVGDGQAVVKGFRYLRKNKNWKKQIRSFIEDGGGIIGICGGAACGAAAAGAAVCGADVCGAAACGAAACGAAACGAAACGADAEGNQSAFAPVAARAVRETVRPRRPSRYRAGSTAGRSRSASAAVRVRCRCD